MEKRVEISILRSEKQFKMEKTGKISILESGGSAPSHTYLVITKTSHIAGSDSRIVISEKQDFVESCPTCIREVI